MDSYAFVRRFKVQNCTDCMLYERIKAYEIFEVLILSAILNVNKTNFHRGSILLNYILEYMNLHRNTQLALNY